MRFAEYALIAALLAVAIAAVVAWTVQPRFMQHFDVPVRAEPMPQHP